MRFGKGGFSNNVLLMKTLKNLSEWEVLSTEFFHSWKRNIVPNSPNRGDLSKR